MTDLYCDANTAATTQAGGEFAVEVPADAVAATEAGLQQALNESAAPAPQAQTTPKELAQEFERGSSSYGTVGVEEEKRVTSRVNLAFSRTRR